MSDRFVALGYRWYRKNAEIWAGVTSILSAILGWSDKDFYQDHTREEVNRMFKIAGDRGTEVHEYIDQLLSGKITLDDIPTKYRDVIKKLQEKVATINPEIIQLEGAVLHKNGWAGTADAIVRVNGKVEVWDWKTGMYKRQHEAQLGAYALAYEDMTGEKVEGLRIFALDLKGRDVKMFTIRQVEYCKRRFLYYFEAWKHLNWKYLKDGIRDSKTGNVYKWEESLIFKDTAEEHIRKEIGDGRTTGDKGSV